MSPSFGLTSLFCMIDYCLSKELRTGLTVDTLTFAEVGFFALDVYYNQTYGSRIGTSAAGSRHDNNNHGIGSGSGSGPGNSFGGSDGDQGPPLLFKPYPKYRDPFLDTYSSYKFFSTYRTIDGASVERPNVTAESILRWISLAHET